MREGGNEDVVDQALQVRLVGWLAVDHAQDQHRCGDLLVPERVRAGGELAPGDRPLEHRRREASAGGTKAGLQRLAQHGIIQPGAH